MMRVLIATLLIVWTHSGPLAIAAPADTIFAGIEQHQFATPEAAIEHFVAAIARSDFAAALGAFSIAPSARRNSFVKTGGRLRAITPGHIFPSEYQSYLLLNEVQLAGVAMREIKAMVTALLLQRPDPYDTIALGDSDEAAESWATRLAQSLDPAGLAKLKIVKIAPPRGLTDPRVVAAFKKRLPSLGADELGQRLVLYDFYGTTLIGGVEVVRFGTSWYLTSLSATYSEIGESAMRLGNEAGFLAITE